MFFVGVAFLALVALGGSDRRSHRALVIVILFTWLAAGYARKPALFAMLRQVPGFSALVIQSDSCGSRSCSRASQRHARSRRSPGYVIAQIAGAFAGVAAAHLMFGERALFLTSQQLRSGTPQLSGEVCLAPSVTLPRCAPAVIGVVPRR